LGHDIKFLSCHQMHIGRPIQQPWINNRRSSRRVWNPPSTSAFSSLWPRPHLTALSSTASSPPATSPSIRPPHIPRRRPRLERRDMSPRARARLRDRVRVCPVTKRRASRGTNAAAAGASRPRPSLGKTEARCRARCLQRTGDSKRLPGGRCCAAATRRTARPLRLLLIRFLPSVDHGTRGSRIAGRKRLEIIANREAIGQSGGS